MKKNLIPLVMIAFVVALISTAVFYGLMAGRMEGKPNVPVKMSVVASRKLEAGRILRAEDLRLAPSTESGILAPEHLEDVLGRKLKKNVEAGRAIPEAMLSAPEERLLSGGIPSGMRAVTIHVSDSTGVMRLLKAGDRVDVQSVVQRQKQGESEVEVSTILQNVTVYQALADSTASQNGRQVLTDRKSVV